MYFYVIDGFREGCCLLGESWCGFTHLNFWNILVEIFKTKENLNTSFMKYIFVERMENYNLRSGNTLQLPKARTTTYGIGSVSFLGSLFWHALPETLKNQKILQYSKEN